MGIIIRPSILSIIWIDFWAFHGAGVGVFTLVYTVIKLLWGEGDLPNVLDIEFLTISIFGTFLLLFSRIRHFLRIYKDGLEVNAMISKVWFSSRQGKIDFEYTYQGEKYEGNVRVMPRPRTKSLREGKSIVVLVDHPNPERALPKELYL